MACLHCRGTGREKLRILVGSDGLVAWADWGPLDRLQQDQPQWFVEIPVNDELRAIGWSVDLFEAVAKAKADYETVVKAKS